MYTNLKTVLEQADKLNMAVGAFNTHSLEMMPAIIRAAAKQGSPVIVQTSVGTAQYIGYKNMVAICEVMGQECGIDVALHLDHAKNFADIKEAIDAGFSSVMFDGSSLPLKDNILKTQQVVSYAKPFDVSVEAELGTVGGTEDGVVVASANVKYTDPKDAIEFVEATGIDALAVAIGTNHGQYKSKTNVNLEVLESIKAAVSVPLVIHGGTGVKDEDVHKVIDRGIRKFNVGTELLVGWNKTTKEVVKDTSDSVSLRNNVIPCLDIIDEVVTRKIKLFKNIKE